MIDKELLGRLNADGREARIRNLKKALESAAFPPADPRYINNHIHTTFSFSPYSPTAAVYAARAEGLATAGIIDHDTMAGTREFLEAAELAGLPVTVGMECRVSMAGTPMADRRLNSADQTGIAYMTIQAVPHDRIETLQDWFEPRRQAREKRNRKMTERINRLLPGIGLDYDRDVRPESMARYGGTVTERHLLYALAKKMTARAGKGAPLIRWLDSLGAAPDEKQRRLLEDAEYAFYEYDLLGVLKAAFLPKIYADAAEECPGIREIAGLCREMDALLCYAYLGDVTKPATGDRKPQKFEDDYLDDLIGCLKELGVPAVTYMPTRNSPEQLARIRRLCEDNGLMQVSGEDINSPRQSFVTRAMEDPRLGNLIDSTWRLIRHEQTKERIV